MSILKFPFFTKKNIIIAAVASILSVIVLGMAFLWLLSIKKRKDINPAFSAYIEAYTAGLVSKRGGIRIQFASNIAAQDTKVDDKDLFSFSPSIKGKAYWINAHTIEFRPDVPLKPGKTYAVTFKLGKLIPVSSELEKFKFDFQVVKPNFKIEQEGLKSFNSSSLDRMKLTGSILLADNEEPAKIEQLLSATCGGHFLNIRWSHDAAQNISRFRIDSVMLAQNEQKLTLMWDGKPIGASTTGIQTLEVPAIGVFKVLNIKAIQEPEQYTLVQFSNPIAVAQDLNGLISISNVSNLHYTIEGSEVKVYAPDRLMGNYTVSVNAGVGNIVGKKITQTKTSSISFENYLPHVALPSKGTILPNSDNLTFPFEATNLKAVDVTIIKIYENNIPQYLQENELNSNYYLGLRRVAKPIVVKTIRLDDDKTLNLKRKNRFSIDINKLLKAEPGAIYNITIGFRKSYALLNTGDSTALEDLKYKQSDRWMEKIDEDDLFWSRYYNYPDNYKWEEKDDPSSDSYYTREHWVTRNVLASNIGLIAKAGENNSIKIVATNILTAAPMAGVKFTILDYQQQILQTITSDADGLASLDLKKKPYLLIASKGNQRGYLKLSDGSSLPLSRFEVEGDIIQKGIKGFVYADRGVWRPGDSVFVGFIMEDRGKKIPEGNPVTFELYNPQGQLYKRIVQTKLLNGFCTFRTATNKVAPTGTWQASVKVGGATFYKSIKIETIMPNRLKLDLTFRNKELSKDAPNDATLTAKWLFGVNANSLKAKVDATLVSGQTSFDKFPKYIFDDPTGTFAAETNSVFDGNLDNAGRATMHFNLKTSANAPGILRANFSTKVFEPGGNFSIDNFSIPYHVYSAYVGIRLPEGDKLSGRLLTDQDHLVNIANVNTGGQLIAGERKVQIELYKIEWRWWWDQEGENLSNFTQNQHNQLLKKETITLHNGIGKWTLRINQPEWGRYLIRVKDLQSGHTTGKAIYVDWPGWAEREQQNNPTEAAMLAFTANKTKYNVGEQVTLTIPSSKNGRGLVSIENGSKVLKTWWIDTEKGQTKCTFKIEPEMAPNIFVNVTLLQPHAQTINDLPIRMYGAIPILVNDPQTILKPIITTANEVRPEENTSITVAEQSGKAMTYHLALVDEGLLDLTRFKTPDPHSVFYAREALGIKTWDVFDYVIGARGGDLERILSIGGDGNINRNIHPNKANRFAPIVKFIGPFFIGKGAKKVHQLKLPPYIGSLRAMVIAGQNGAYGSAEKNIAVKKPLMLLATLPRIVGPNENFKLPITLFASSELLKNVSVAIESNELLAVANAKQLISFEQPGEKVIYSNVKVGNKLGIAKVKIIAKSGREQATYEVELEIRNPNPYITSITGAELEKGKRWTSSIAPLGAVETSSAVIEVSTIPGINLDKRLNYLIQYPHGCVEQTTSALFAQLMLSQLMSLSPARKATVERNLKVGIERLKSFQMPDGGLGYWPGEKEGNEWGTNYVGHFMLEAQSRGYNLPIGFLDRWKHYQKNKAVMWAPKNSNSQIDDLTQAYRLYVLALAKSPEVGAMNRLKEFQYLSTAAKWRLAATYNLIGQTEVAKRMIKGLSYQINPYTELGGTFGSDLRDQAMILETLTELGQKTQAAKLLLSVTSKFSVDAWYSTQTTAYALIAMAKYLGQNKSGAKMNYTYTLNGIKKEVSADATLIQIPLNVNSRSLSLINEGDNKLFVRLIRQGQAPTGVNPSVANNAEVLIMKLVYKTLKGKIIDPTKLTQGTDFVVEVTLNNPGKRTNYEQMVLTQIFPSGWEIINTRLSDNEGMLTSSPYTYRDIRDDRVLTYFDLKKRETRTYQVLLNASYTGRYYLPAISCEAMYSDVIQAQTAGKWVEVVE